MNARVTMYMLLVIVGIIYISYVTAAPTDPVAPNDLDQYTSERLNISNFPNQTIDAEAGNVSELVFDTVSTTNAWAGYYGNISGVIVLDDASGNTFYNWSVAEPKGEIYASTNGTITWANIHCFNFTDDGSVDINVTTEETRYNMIYNDVDGIDETYTSTTHPEFYVGTYTISVDTCPTTHPFQDDAPQTSYFYNVLLSDNSSLIFTTIIENDDDANNTDVSGYNGEIVDFQLLVAEDGHNGTGQDTLTEYYFFVDIQ